MRRLARALLVGTALHASLAAADGGGPGGLQCRLQAPAEVAVGQPVMLRFTLSNTGARPLQLLHWNTPFEGWFGAYVQVWRDGVELPYQGPMVKRADPTHEQYLRLGPGQSRSAEVDLALPFELHAPGLYRVQPRLQLADVIEGDGKPPRPRARHAGRPLACNAVQVRVRE